MLFRSLFDAAAGFGGTRESGFGREGGWEGLQAYSKPSKPLAEPTQITAFTGKGAAAVDIDRTAKLFIGGKQARPDGGYSQAIFSPKGKLLGHAPIANRKDIRNAVQAQLACGWGKTTGHLGTDSLLHR